jgi:tellurite methyltransferase
MGRADRDKWDARYREGAYADRAHPSALLAEWLPKLELDSARRRAADIGCGAGRNALYLGRLGWRIDALDISQVALERLAAAATAERVSINCIQADLEDLSSLPAVLDEAESYDLVIMVRYTNLPLIERLTQILKMDGYLIVEEHLETKADVVGPRNPQFRVVPGALREAAGGLEIIAYREGIVADPDGRLAALAQLIATKAE